MDATRRDGGVQLEQGLRGSITRRVTDDLSAHSLGVPGAHVLASPMLCLLFEHAAIEAIRGVAGPQLRTLGIGLTLAHDSPTPVGFDVVVEALLVEVRGRHLRFALEARDDLETVATGTHDRVIVDWERVLKAIAQKRESVSSAP